MISIATVREPAQRIGKWMRIGQGPVAYACGTECDRKGSVKGEHDHGVSDGRRAGLPVPNTVIHASIGASLDLFTDYDSGLQQIMLPK